MQELERRLRNSNPFNMRSSRALGLLGAFSYVSDEKQGTLTQLDDVTPDQASSARPILSQAAAGAGASRVMHATPLTSQITASLLHGKHVGSPSGFPEQADARRSVGRFARSGGECRWGKPRIVAREVSKWGRRGIPGGDRIIIPTSPLSRGRSQGAERASAMYVSSRPTSSGPISIREMLPSGSMKNVAG